MYVPTAFSETNVTKLHDFMEQHSFATLISSDNSLPNGSHLPLLLDRERGPLGTLIGHMAKANPQWHEAKDQRVLVIFHGPHVYVSPTWYDDVNVVPTWNYVAVHAYGVLRLVEDRDQLMEMVRRLVETHEADLPQPWSVNSTEPGFVEGLLNGIVGFEVTIDRLEGKWKLNQNHDVARRQRVVDALRQETSDHARQIAEWMAERSEK